jgi:hypothetical protein
MQKETDVINAVAILEELSRNYRDAYPFGLHGLDKYDEMLLEAATNLLCQLGYSVDKDNFEEVERV